jgi:hypothetical protein
MIKSLFGKPRGTKIYRGAYEYSKNDNIYAEENFEVYRDPNDMGIHFVGQQMARVSTGEILRVNMDYIMTKDFIPMFVSVEKVLGKDHVKELYAFDQKRNCCLYEYESKTFKKQEELIVTPKFHISTPLACTSCTFIKSKKEDPTAKNLYLTLKSFNNWNYIDTPEMQVLTLQRMNLTSENITISGNTVQATKYKLFEEEQEDLSNVKKKIINPPVIKVALSKYSAIPYSLQTSDGIKVQIKYLNDLEPD